MPRDLNVRTLTDLIGKPWSCPCQPPDNYDCWALVVEVRKRLGIQIPDYLNRGSFKYSDRKRFKNPPKTWRELEAPIPGCIVRTGKGGTHVGVYLAKDQIINSMYGVGVCVSKLVDPMFTGGSVSYWEYDNA